MSNTAIRKPTEFIRAIRAQMAKIALEQFHEVDARTALVMARQGILQDLEPLQPSAAALDAARERTESSTNILAGPLLLVHEHGHRTRTIEYPVLWLLSPSSAIREIAIKYFAALYRHPRSPAANKVLEAIDASSRTLLEVDAVAWSEAALTLFDLIDGDWDMKLASLSQCLEWRFMEGANELLPSVLRPSFSSAAASSSLLLELRRGRESLAESIRNDARRCLTAREVSSEYLARYGALPFSGDLSLGAALTAFKELHPGTDLWNELWLNDAGLRHPSQEYHTVVAFLNNLSWVPEASRGTLSGALQRLIKIAGEDGLNEAEAPWALREILARHYLRFLECGSPRSEGDLLAVIAWELANKVAAVFERPEAAKLESLELIVKPEARSSEHLWQILQPSGGDSLLRRGTLFTDSTWLQSLIGELAEHLGSGRVSYAIIPQSIISEIFTRAVVSLFPFTLKHDPTPVFGLGLLPTLLNGQVVYSEELTSVRETLTSLTKYIQSSASPEEVGRLLRDFASTSDSQLIMACHICRTIAPREPALDDVLWELIRNSEWRASFFTNAHPKCLEMIGETLLLLQQSNASRWHPSSLHLLAAIIELEALPEDRVELLVALLIVGSISSGATSAVKRSKLQSSLKTRPYFESWKAKLDRMRNTPVPWAVSRFRRIQVALA